MAVIRRKTSTILVSVIITILTFACVDAGSLEKSFPTTISDSRDLRIYFFDPETAMKWSGQDKKILMPLTKITADEYLNSGPPPEKSQTYLWKYNDYLDFANIIQKQTWGDDAAFEWSLLRMSFNADCQNSLDGFSRADIYYFRSVTVDGVSKYAGREILIRPLYGDVVSGSGTNYPRPYWGEWESIDLSKLKITPDGALQIAEKNGGKAFRNMVANDCRMLFSYAAQRSEGWIVLYSSRRNTSEKFEMNIDPYTGEFKVISEQWKAEAGNVELQ